MVFTRNTLTRIRAMSLVLAVILALTCMVWIQASASPVAAQGPADDSGMSVQIVPVEEDFNAAAIGTTPVFYIGDQFRVSIVAENVEDPGIFGGQFQINYETEYVSAVDGSITPGAALEPVVVAVKSIDNEAGLVEYAASRQGDLENLKGNVVLATLSFEAVGATEPPEGATTVIHLQSAKLGAKGGVEVPVTGLVDLEIIIRDGNGNGKGDIAGNVMVEGRADDKQAGHTVSALGESASEALEATTDDDGHFVIKKAPSDMYEVTANSAGFLAATCEGVDHSVSELTTLDDVKLLAGDINDDGEIDIVDAAAIGLVFGSTEPGEVADLNIDGEVDILDLILMSANYGQTSVDNPWICQGGPDTEL